MFWRKLGTDITACFTSERHNLRLSPGLEKQARQLSGLFFDISVCSGLLRAMILCLEESNYSLKQ